MGLTPITYAIDKNKINSVELLISKGANLNHNLSNGQSPLSIAVEEDNLEMAKLLVENGAAFNTHDGDGATPFQNAVIENRMAIVKFCRENGANLVMRTVNFRNNSLELAMKHNHIDMLKQLIHQLENV